MVAVNNMTILVTGSSGLVGKNIVDRLSNIYELLCPTSKELNLINSREVDSYLREQKPEMIIHCAGFVGGIQANIKQPVRFLSDNSYMGLNIINGAFKADIKQVINLGSSCMYPRNGENPLKEELVLTGELEPTNEGYAIAKILTERLCEYYNREYGVQYKTLIPCNLYGRYDKFNPEHSHMVPSVIRKIHLANINDLEEVEIWGNGQARREFMYAGELANFISFAIENFKDLPDLLNVGLGYDYTINEYYQVIANIIGYKGTFIHDLKKPEGMNQKLVDVSKLKKLGWESKMTLEEGIQETYNYFKKVSVK